MAKLKVEIVTPERRLAQCEADEVVAPGVQGLFGVRPGHTAYLALMQPGPLTVRGGEGAGVYFVSGGFVEAGPSAVRVLADSAERQADIDVPRSKQRLAEAEEKLRSLEATDPRAEVQRQLIRLEQKRLEVALP